MGPGTLVCYNLRQLHWSKKNYRNIIVIGQITGSGQIDIIVHLDKKLKYDVEYIFCSLYICFLLLNWVNLYLVTVLNMSFLSIFSDMLKQ